MATAVSSPRIYSTSVVVTTQWPRNVFFAVNEPTNSQRPNRPVRRHVLQANIAAAVRTSHLPASASTGRSIVHVGTSWHHAAYNYMVRGEAKSWHSLLPWVSERVEFNT